MRKATNNSIKQGSGHIHRITNGTPSINGSIDGWEIKTLGLTLLVIVIILICIWYSYKLTNRGPPEGFKTYGELVNELNANRTAIMNIKQLQEQKLVDIDPNVDKYITANAIFPDELKDKLATDFDIRFSQQLQDTDIKDLQNQLDVLKQKLTKLPPTPTRYMLKSLGGSAFNMLGTPNDFSLQINPQEARCLSFSPLGYNNPSETTETLRGVEKTYESAGIVQCDIGGSDKSQRFKLTEINNNREFNKLVGDLHSVPNYYNLNNYPFLVAQPMDGQLRVDGLLGECITFDSSGLSVEPCTGKDTQRWHSYTVSD